MCVTVDFSNRRDLRGTNVISSTTSFWVDSPQSDSSRFRPGSSPKWRVEAWSSTLSNVLRRLPFRDQLRDSRPNLALFPPRVFPYAARVAESWPRLRIFTVRLRRPDTFFRSRLVLCMNWYPSLAAPPIGWRLQPMVCVTRRTPTRPRPVLVKT